MHETLHFDGKRLRELRVPLGGMGTGCLSLAGDGRLVDWEIANRPGKGATNGFSHFAVVAARAGESPVARVLQGDLPPPYMGTTRGRHVGIGFGVERECLSGLPHFATVEAEVRYPLATLRFRDDTFPGQVELLAFNPLIPGNAHASGIPAAFFEVTIHNPTAQPIDYTVAGTLANPLPELSHNRLRRRGTVKQLHLTTPGTAPDSVTAGDVCLATDAQEVGGRENWFGNSWFDALEIYWQDLTGKTYWGPDPSRRAAPRRGGHGTLAARVRVPAGASRRVRMVISWNVPTCTNYWDKQAADQAREDGIPVQWRNYYATQWKDAAASARYALKHWDRLLAETRRFVDALLQSTLPTPALEAVIANLSTLKTPTVLRLEDGTFYGFEGCMADEGCCPGTCTHVWNYAQALPFLFPDLERSVRDADYRYNQQPDGGMPFRLNLPLGVRSRGGRSCADGLFGNVMMVYRDWKICGDTAWLRRVWPAVKRSMEFTWNPRNPDRWDPERTGVLWGRQHHTLDMELFGPSAWLCGFYLGALKAAAEMALHLGEDETAADYLALFTRGRAWVDEHLFNGEYFVQQIDLKARDVPASFGAEESYWNAEHKQIKYQIGQGCAIDQVLAQWHANLYGLGSLFDPGKVNHALRAILRHNFKSSFREVANPCRVFALNDEQGAVICDWPAGRERPAIPVVYAQETMCGFEYAAACQMIQNGLVKEGMALVKAVRDRHDGEKRNPFNEFECGSHYARSMASYGLLQAFSGFEFDAVRGMIGFSPVVAGERDGFRCFWALESGWGTMRLSASRLEITVLSGRLPVREIRAGAFAGQNVARVSAGPRALVFRQEAGAIHLAGAVTIPSGQALVVTWRPAKRRRVAGPRNA